MPDGTRPGRGERERGPWRSVRVRITVASVAVFALAFGLTASVLVSSVQRALVDQIEGDQAGTVNRITDSLAAGAPPPDAVGGGAGTFVCRIDRPEDAGAGTATASAAGTGALGGGRELHPCRGSVTGAGPPPGAAGPDPALGAPDMLVKTFDVDTPSGVQTLQVTSPLSSVQRSVDTLTRVLLMVTPLLILGVGTMVWWLVGRALHPVERLRREVDAISHSTLDRRVRLPGSHDEIERLAQTMNGMLDRLQRAAVEQQRFVSDASHELRTPLSVIRTTIDVSRRHPASLPATDALDRIDQATTRTEDLVDELLTLARIGEATTTPAVPVDLAQLVTAAVTGLDDGRVETVADAARVPGDPGQLRRLVDNLVANAVAHCRHRVVVRTGTDGAGTAVVTVDDDGPGIPPEARATVFERFARLEDSRARPSGAGGWGLGLAIAEAVVRRHHGTIEVGDAPAGGARFTVRLPAER